MSALALCRMCARPSSARLQPLFTRPENYGRYALALKLATGLQIEMNDGLPQYICKECSQEVNRVLKFRTNSQKAQTKFFELGFRKINIHDRANEPAHLPATMKNKLLVQENDLDSDESLDSDCDLDDFNSFADVRDLDNSKIDVKVEFHTEKSQMNLNKYLDTTAPLYTCKECRKIYKSKGSFGRHIDIHTGLEFMCDRCGKVFWSRTMLLRHQRAIHGAARDISLRCPHCEYHGLDNRHLTEHIRTHTGERPFICDACGAGFTGRELLVQHLTVHITERNVQCEECPAKFKTRHDLFTHRWKRHKPRRWRFQCVYCPNMYVTSFNCRTHMRKSHGIPNDQQEKPVRVPVKLEPNAQQVMT